MKKIYFCGSIRGGRSDASLYQHIIAHMKEENQVLTEHIGNLSLSLSEKKPGQDLSIYKQDTDWLKESDIVIAECTCPSLGVGYELAYAERLEKPTYVFFRKSESSLSAMINGDPFFHICSYETEEELIALIDSVLKQ